MERLANVGNNFFILKPSITGGLFFAIDKIQYRVYSIYDLSNLSILGVTMSRPVGSKNKATLERESRVDASPVVIVDGWSNVLAGLGGQNDKTLKTTKDDFELIDDETLSAIYMSEGLGRRIVDTFADDMTREWIYLDDEESPSEEAKTINEELIRLEAEPSCNEAIRWQRLFGGSLMIIGAMDGRTPDSPLDETRIKNIEYLKIVDRTDIDIGRSFFDKNAKSPTFGKVLRYFINYHFSDGTYIPMSVHYTRCIPFFNDPIPARARIGVPWDNRYWGMSSLQSIYEELRDLGGISQSVLNILYEFIIARFKIKDLSKVLSLPDGEKKITQRLQVMNATKSIINAVVMDSEDDFERQYSTTAGLPELIDRFMLKLAGSTGIPVTRLFGRSPAGLNATGENDLRNYYDLVEAQQRNRLMPSLHRLIELICAWKKIEKIPTITFNSLYQLSEEEKANIENKEANTKKTRADELKIYVDMGALDPDEVRNDELKLPGPAPNPQPTAEELLTLKAKAAPQPNKAT